MPKKRFLEGCSPSIQSFFVIFKNLNILFLSDSTQTLIINSLERGLIVIVFKNDFNKVTTSTSPWAIWHRLFGCACWDVFYSTSLKLPVIIIRHSVVLSWFPRHAFNFTLFSFMFLLPMIMFICNIKGIKTYLNSCISWYINDNSSKSKNYVISWGFFSF